MAQHVTRAALGAVVLCAALGQALVSTPAQAAPVNRWAECRYQYANGKPGWTPYEVARTIDCAAAHFGVSASEAHAVADRESHHGQFSTNPYSYACGVFQHIPRYFRGRLLAVPDWLGPFGHPWSDPTVVHGARSRCYNARDNVLAALWMVHTSGWWAWGG